MSESKRRADRTRRTGRQMSPAPGRRAAPGTTQTGRIAVFVGIGVVLLVGAVAGVSILANRATQLPPGLEGLPVQTVEVDGRALVLAVADDTTEGLTGVDDLGELDGMFFAFDTEQDPASNGFWMKGVTIPLDVAFFDATGRLVDVIAMPLCTSDPCPIYVASRPYLWAIETPTGTVTYAEGANLIRD